MGFGRLLSGHNFHKGKPNKLFGGGLLFPLSTESCFAAGFLNNQLILLLGRLCFFLFFWSLGSEMRL